MQKPATREKTWTSNLYLTIIGFGIGWLIGLSVSPVVSIVITSITAAAAAIVATLTGLDEKVEERKLKVNISPLPLALLVVGILIGSAFGISARNRHWFGSDVSSEIEKWTDQGVSREEIVNRLFQSRYPYLIYTGEAYTATLNAEIERWTKLKLSREEVVRRLFDRIYPLNDTSSAPTGTSNGSTDSVLFAVAAQECDSLLAAASISRATSDNLILLDAINSSTSRNIWELPNIVTDTKALEDIVEKVLCVKD